jgi:hypothetical protein
VDIDKAIDGMLKTRAALRSKRGITDPQFISENMQRLAQYTGAIEEHMGEIEEKLEVDEGSRFTHYTKTEGRSVNQSEILAKQEVSETKGQIAKLKRFVNSSWQIVDVARSRFNHLTIEKRENGHIT